MKKYFIYCLLMNLFLNSSAQNNPIFGGGEADGFTNNNYLQPGSNIYTGGEADGWSVTSFTQPFSNIFSGGDADGWANTNFSQPVYSIYNGGEADGWAYTIYLQAGNNIFNGGEADGWASTYRPLGPLPLLLTFFNAAKFKETAALLTWKTTQEVNTAFFDLERSEDGISFNKIAQLISAGNSQTPTNYSFTDYAPLTGNNFYRIKMVDKDGTFTYSIYRQLNFVAAYNRLVKFYPNPTKGKLFLDFNSVVAKENKVISIYTASGNLIRQFNNAGNGSTKLEIDFSSYPKGTYFIQVKTNQDQHTQRIVIQ